MSDHLYSELLLEKICLYKLITHCYGSFSQLFNQQTIAEGFGMTIIIDGCAAQRFVFNQLQSLLEYFK